MEGENGSDLNWQCWNEEISFRHRKYGEHNVKVFQRDLLALGINNLDFVVALQEALRKSFY